MIAEIEHFKTGWHGICLRFTSEEIDRFIRSLQSIQQNGGHFHFEPCDFQGNCGIADIEISLKGENKLDNMKVM